MRLYKTLRKKKAAWDPTWPTLEHCMPAVYRATTGVLEELDRVQDRFLKAVDLNPANALLRFNLAPLQTRRDMAMLGAIHRTVLGEGPPHFQRWFVRVPRKDHGHNTRAQEKLHSKQLFDFLEQRDTELLRRSVLGLVRVYNRLPQEAVDKPSVKAFQRWLQDFVRGKAALKKRDWVNCLNLRKRSFKQTRA